MDKSKKYAEYIPVITAYQLPVMQKVVCHFMFTYNGPISSETQVQQQQQQQLSTLHYVYDSIYALFAICYEHCWLLQSSNDNCLCLSEESYLNRPYVEEIA